MSRGSRTCQIWGLQNACMLHRKEFWIVMHFTLSESGQNFEKGSCKCKQCKFPWILHWCVLLTSLVSYIATTLEVSLNYTTYLKLVAFAFTMSWFVLLSSTRATVASTEPICEKIYKKQSTLSPSLSLSPSQIYISGWLSNPQDSSAAPNSFRIKMGRPL